MYWRPGLFQDLIKRPFQRTDPLLKTLKKGQTLSRDISHVFLTCLLLKIQLKFNSDDPFAGPLAGPFQQFTAPHSAPFTGQTTRLSDTILSLAFGPDYALGSSAKAEGCHALSCVPRKAHLQRQCGT